MAHPICFDLHNRSLHPRTPRNPIPHSIRVGDIVRQRPNGLPLHVIVVDGAKVYCDGFIDPFDAASLEIVTPC